MRPRSLTPDELEQWVELSEKGDRITYTKSRPCFNESLAAMANKLEEDGRIALTSKWRKCGLKKANKLVEAIAIRL